MVWTRDHFGNVKRPSTPTWELSHHFTQTHDRHRDKSPAGVRESFGPVPPVEFTPPTYAHKLPFWKGSEKPVN